MLEQEIIDTIHKSNSEREHIRTKLTSPIKSWTGSEIWIDVPRSNWPKPNQGSFQVLISDRSSEFLSDSAILIREDIYLGDQSYHRFKITEPESSEPDRLILVMPTALDLAKPILLKSLPHHFTTVNFGYDFTKNPGYRDCLSAIAKTRVPADNVDSYSDRKSSMIGYNTGEGIDVMVGLYLQDPNPNSRLKCYEVEIFSSNRRQVDPTDIVRESFYQARELHYCMTDRFGSYPFVPAEELGDISKLGMMISYHGNSPEVMFDLLHDLPLSLEGTNQWCAKGHFGNGFLELLCKPEWGGNNAALVYRQESSDKITRLQNYKVMEGMMAVRDTLTKN